MEDKVTNAILDALRCVGATNGTVYVTVPITTGLREFQLMRDLSCDRETLRTLHRQRWLAEVKELNEADAAAYTLMVQLQNEDRLVLNPAALQVDGWTQEHYGSMWSQVLLQFCDKLVVTPDWAFSVGARHEVQQMYVLGREVVDVFDQQLTPAHVLDADRKAHETLSKMGWSDDEIAKMLPTIKLPRNPGLSTRRFQQLEFNSAIKWFIDERNWQNREPGFRDLERTLADGPKAENGSWRGKLDKYYRLAQEAGIETPEGGTHLFAFVSLAIAMVENVGDVFGPLPEPGLSRGAAIQMGRLHSPDMDINHRLAITVAWLLREMYYVRTKFPEHVDDENTGEGIGDDSWWTRQLNLYWRWAHSDGLDTPKGRQALGKFASTAVGLAISRIRLYGLPDHPVPLRADELARRGLFDS